MEDNKVLARGDLVSLRNITRDDTDLVIKWRNNKRVMDNFVYRETFTREIHENWLRNRVDTGEVIQLIICENERDLRPVGSVYFRYTDDTHKEAEYGIFIGEDDAIGKGYGNETAIIAIKYVRENTDIERLILRAFTFNTAAIKSYEHAGFVKTTDMPMVECSDGTKSDMILMERSLQ